MDKVLGYLKEFNYVSVCFRLLLALISGALIGYGRAKKKQSAGLRTYMLTCVGAALTMLIAMYENAMLNGDWSLIEELPELKFDGSRFSTQVIQGIGFLAAGTIIAGAHMQVSGLTTAVGLFANACIGIACGAGFYECVFLALVGVIFTMEIIQPMEVEFKRRMRHITIWVEFNSLDDIDKVTEVINREGATIYNIDIERSEKTGDHFPSAIFTLKLSKENSSHSSMISSIAELPCVFGTRELIS
jgi:putative Mg2+ transporter-C (MgtC) family protein